MRKESDIVTFNQSLEHHQFAKSVLTNPKTYQLNNEDKLKIILKHFHKKTFINKAILTIVISDSDLISNFNNNYSPPSKSKNPFKKEETYPTNGLMALISQVEKFFFDKKHSSLQTKQATAKSKRRKGYESLSTNINDSDEIRQEENFYHYFKDAALKISKYHSHQFELHSLLLILLEQLPEEEKVVTYPKCLNSFNPENLIELVSKNTNNAFLVDLKKYCPNLKSRPVEEESALNHLEETESNENHPKSNLGKNNFNKLLKILIQNKTAHMLWNPIDILHWYAQLDLIKIDTFHYIASLALENKQTGLLLKRLEHITDSLKLSEPPQSEDFLYNINIYSKFFSLAPCLLDPKNPIDSNQINTLIENKKDEFVKFLEQNLPFIYKHRHFLRENIAYKTTKPLLELKKLSIETAPIYNFCEIRDKKTNNTDPDQINQLEKELEQQKYILTRLDFIDNLRSSPQSLEELLRLNIFSEDSESETARNRIVSHCLSNNNFLLDLHNKRLSARGISGFNKINLLSFLRNLIDQKDNKTLILALENIKECYKEEEKLIDKILSDLEEYREEQNDSLFTHALETLNLDNPDFTKSTLQQALTESLLGASYKIEKDEKSNDQAIQAIKNAYQTLSEHRKIKTLVNIREKTQKENKLLTSVSLFQKTGNNTAANNALQRSSSSSTLSPLLSSSEFSSSSSLSLA